MTSPGAGRRKGAARQTPLYDEMRQVVDQMKTAADMLAQASASTEALSKSADKAFQSTTATLQVLMSQMQAVNGGQFGPVIGGTQTPGYNFNRPILQGPGGYQPPVSAYPGPGNPSFGGGHGPGGSPFGYNPNPYAHRGTPLGRMQRGVGQYLNNRFGLSMGGTVASYSPLGHGRYALHAPDGSPIIDPATGTVRTIGQGEMALRTGVSQVAGGLAEGEGVLGALTRVPAIGYAVAAGESVYKLGQFIGDQRGANAQYQSIYGPGTSGFDQRMHQFGGRFRNWASNLGSFFGYGPGGLTDSDYNTAFKAISGMGYQGGTRNDMLNFATNNFNSMGMGVNESLQLLDANSKQTSTSLSELSDQLLSVSKMAQAAGQSADVFRQKYIDTYTQNVNNGLGGGSGPLAMANTAITAGMGRTFTGYNASSMYSTIGGQQFLASSAGYSDVTSFMFAAQQNPTVMSTAMDAQIDRILNQSTPPEVRQAAMELIQRNGGRAAIVNDQTGGVAGRIYQELAKRFNLQAVVYQVQSGLASIGFSGININDPAAVAAYWIKWIATGGSMMTKQVTTAMQQYQRATPTSSNDKMKALFSGGANLVGGKLVNDQLISKLYTDNVKSVEVQTSAGQQTVSLDTAVQHYRGQLLNGSALLGDGPQAGTSIANAYGREYGVTAPMGYGYSAKGKAIFDASTQKYINGLGLTMTQQEQLRNYHMFGDKVIMSQAQKMAENNKGGGTVTLDLTPAAKALVQPSLTGNIDYPAANNTVPTTNPQGASYKGPGG